MSRFFFVVARTLLRVRSRRVCWVTAAALVGLGACESPSRDVLRSPDNTACVGVGEACEPVTCFEDKECEPTFFCSGGGCVSCDLAAHTCDECPPDTDPTPVLRNDCAVCECLPPVCDSHSACPHGFLCLGGQCVTCEMASSACDRECGLGFTTEPFFRNGCAVCECVPPTECFEDDDCPPEQKCYEGVHCEDDCEGPWCCRGNRCAEPGCDSLITLGCAVAGCAGGLDCVADCPPTQCECIADDWICSGDCDEAVCKVPPF